MTEQKAPDTTPQTSGKPPQAKGKAKGTKGNTTAKKRRSTGEARRKHPDISQYVKNLDLMAAVCTWFIQGHGAVQIKKLAKDTLGVEMTREAPYALIKEACRRGYLLYQAPPNAEYRHTLRLEHPWLASIEVVNTVSVPHVALAAARELLQIVRSIKKKEVHIGLAGGHSMREMAKSFARLLCEPHGDLPESIWFHALAAGFDPGDPTTNPNGFFQFYSDPVIRTRVHFHGLSAPAMINPQYMEWLKQLGDIQQAFDAAQRLDVIATSGSRLTDPHCALVRRLQESQSSMEALQRENCVGDILWRPIGPQRPIDTATELRAMTLVDLHQLPGFIRENGCRVLLMLAPCGQCHEPKGELLASVLGQEQKLITDLVVDSLTVRQMLSQRSKP